QRGKKYKDNLEKLPPRPAIADDGPKYYQASMNCETMLSLLSKKGHPARISTSAGRYLCEEALYSLEYLKSKHQLEATVMFCHVPPLNTEIGKALVILGGSTLGFMGSGQGQGTMLAAASVLGG